MKKYIENEVKVQEALVHPNIVQVVQYIDSEKAHIFVLEFCEMGSLSHILKKRGKLFGLKEGIEVVKQVCQGLVAIH
jgi:serine/threonine protein kinase